MSPHPVIKAVFFWIVAALMILASDAAFAKDTWRTLAKPKFTIVSAASDSRTRDAAANINDFVDCLGHLVQVDQHRLRPLTIVIFATDAEFDAYKPRLKDGRMIDSVQEELDMSTGSDTGSGMDWAVIAMAGHYDERATDHVVMAGCAYWYLAALDFRLPLAVSHGAAQMFSTFKRRETHGTFGLPIPLYVKLLNRWPLMPVERLLAINDMGSVVLSDQRVVFGAESWALAHYLMFAHGPAERHAFGRFLSALGHHLSPHEALIKALGPKEAAEIDSSLTSYIHSRWYTIEMDLPPRVRDAQPIVPADTAEIEVALTKVALAAHLPTALGHADAAVAAGPDRPETHAIRAEALLREHAPKEKIQAEVTAALAHGSQNPGIFLLDAESSLHEASAGASEPERARTAVNRAEKSILLNPSIERPFDFIARTLGRCPRVTDDDGKFLEFGRKRFPDDRWILLGQAAFARQRGDAAAAQKLQDEALSEDARLDGSQLKAIRAFVARKPAP